MPALVIFRVPAFPDVTFPVKPRGKRLLFMFGHRAPSSRIDLGSWMATFWNYAQELVEARATEPRDDFTSDLLLARDKRLARAQPSRVTTVVFGLLLAGHETTTSLLGNALRRMLTHRAAWNEICVDPH